MNVKPRVKGKTKVGVEAKTEVVVKVLRGFALNLQGSFLEGDVVTLHFGRIQKVGVLTPERYKDLLGRGYIEVIDPLASGQKEEVSDGGI